jgi:hypothetical protein
MGADTFVAYVGLWFLIDSKSEGSWKRSEGGRIP